MIVPQTTFTNSSYLEPNKRDLHGKDGAQTVNCAVCHIDSVRKSPC